jgi:hypothetical protein
MEVHKGSDFASSFKRAEGAQLFDQSPFQQIPAEAGSGEVLLCMRVLLTSPVSLDRAQIGWLKLAGWRKMLAF